MVSKFYTIVLLKKLEYAEKILQLKHLNAFQNLTPFLKKGLCSSRLILKMKLKNTLANS